MKRRREFYIRFIIITVIVTGLAAGAMVFLYSSQNRQNPTSSVVFSNELYTLRGRPTDFQKALFRELTAAVEKRDRNDLEVVTLVAKNFVADYFTWSNKVGPFDVGGLDFVYGLENLNFRATSREYFNTYMYTYLEKGIRIQDLIEVIEIETPGADFAAPYFYYDQELPAFYIELSWKYKENDVIDTSIFQTWAAMTIIVTEEGRFEIVRFY
jgi:hypothetical protein